jgi:putative ABC transport system permease protein
VIGISSVITLLNLGQAAQQYITDSVSSIGSSLISINAGSFSFSSGPANLEALSSTFTLDEAKALISSPRFFVAGISAETPKSSTIQFQNNSQTSSISGIYGDYWQVRNVEIAKGREINTKDIDQLAKVAVIGPDLVTKLFNGEEPVGQKLKIGNQSFTVIGITEARGSNGFTNLDE